MNSEKYFKFSPLLLKENHCTRLIQPWGERSPDEEKGFHRGIDLVVSDETGSKSLAAKIVNPFDKALIVFNGQLVRAGNTVIIMDMQNSQPEKRILAIFMHLVNNVDRTFELIGAKDIIGMMGNSGGKCDVHLHLGLAIVMDKNLAISRYRSLKDYLVDPLLYFEDNVKILT